MDLLLVASGLLTFASTRSSDYILLALLLVFMMGVFQLLFGLINGDLVNFLLKPVISGFTSAAAIIIALSQLKHFTGVDITRNNKIQFKYGDFKEESFSLIKSAFLKSLFNLA